MKMMNFKQGMWTICIGVALAGMAAASTIAIDFEGAFGDLGLYYVNGFKTKSPSIIASVDKPAGSPGVQSAQFTWFADGVYSFQYAYMVKDLDATYDFSNALMSYWHKRTNRSTWVGVALFSNGQLAAEWRIPMSSSWIQATVNVATLTPTKTGTGSLTAINAIGFMHINTTQPGSGTGHTVLFDDFIATNVVPEPAAMLLLIAGSGLCIRRRRH